MANHVTEASITALDPFRALASIAYTRCGRTMTQYRGIKADVDSSENDWRSMTSNRLAVIAASLQCTDEVKVVSRGTPRSRTSVTWGIWWLVSAAEKG